MNYAKKEKANFGNVTKNLMVLAILPLICLACSMFGGSSPTAVYKAFIAAAMKKDAAAMKEYLSEDALKSLTDAAKYSGKSEDEILKSFSEEDEPIDISNEKIADDGKTASLEIKTRSESRKTIYFVKDGSWKLAFDKPKEKTGETVETTPTASPGSSEPKDTSPVTISASSLIDEALSSSEGLEKYRGRIMTVTDAELWEIQYGMLHIGKKYGSYYSGYIICSGNFSQYEPYKSKISDLRKAGKSPGATIKGTFSKVVRDSGSTQVHLEPCVLSSLDK